MVFNWCGGGEGGEDVRRTAGWSPVVHTIELYGEALGGRKDSARNERYNLRSAYLLLTLIYHWYIGNKAMYIRRAYHHCLAA
jgi:hypothetical protein